MVIKDLVLDLVKKENTNDPFVIAKNKKIIIFFEELGSLMGYHNYDSRFHFIHINKALSYSEKIFTCAHELGHVLLHPKTNTSFLKRSTFFSVDKIEYQAHKFAVELLLPDSLLQQNSEFSLYSLANSVGIPSKLAQLKIKNLHQSDTFGCRF